MYESYFDLRETAFSNTPDSRFVWLSSTAEEGLAALYYGIQHRKGFILLTGEVGAGKTTLLRAVLRCLPEESVDAPGTALVMNTAGLTQLDVLKLVAAEFKIGGNLRSRADLIIGLDSFLLRRLEDGLNTVLIIDEAQNLSPRALEQVRLLSNLETESHKLLQIVLSGQPELRQKLAAPGLEQLRQRVAVEHHVGPLAPEEVLRYLRHRIQVAGGRYEQIFAPGCDKVFARFSGGRPRVINNLADRVLVAAYGRRLRPIPESFVLEKAQEMVAAMAVPPPKLDPVPDLTPCSEASPDDASRGNGSVAGAVADALQESTPAHRANGETDDFHEEANDDTETFEASSDEDANDDIESFDALSDEDALEAAAEDFLFEDAPEEEPAVREVREEQAESPEGTQDEDPFIDPVDEQTGWDWETTREVDPEAEGTLAATSEGELAELTDDVDDEGEEFLDAALADEPGEPVPEPELPRASEMSDYPAAPSEIFEDEPVAAEASEDDYDFNGADSAPRHSGLRYLVDEGTGELGRSAPSETKGEPLTLDISGNSFWRERAVLINGCAQVLAAALFAVAPLLLEMAGLNESMTWRFASGALALFSGVIVAGGVATRISRHYEFVGGDIVVWLYAIHVSIAACLALHALGALPTSGPLFYTLGLVWLLAMASLNFALLALRGRPPTGAKVNSRTA